MEWNKFRKITNFYSVEQRINFGSDEGKSQPDIDAKETESERKLFRRLIFMQYKSMSMQLVLSRLIENEDLYSAFPNLEN